MGRKSTKYTTMAVPRLKERFVKEVVSSLKEKFQYKSVMQVPKITKIVINKGVGAAVSDKKLVDVAVEEITLIAGQRAVATISKKAISNFKLRENMPIGVKVTLRGDRMYEFLDRLTTVSLPRVRDFKGVSEKGFDGRGNYTLGVKEQIIFPQGGIEKREGSIHISNLMVVENGKPVRTGRKLNEKGKLQRYSKVSGKFIA